ncbi:primosomal protein N' [Caldibacillus thermolactis]|jgi:primosomal protein N' (replication factor Y) (superfamily II helicase)|uniref:Replication restart protein PriA n=1 Tax=Pallidibacillus thermolactis TaxID=251051 RepID=A0ABT2WCE2_9BACI|nr:primosomal protein N' [Pallidibacillus thermolactis]MCU9593142.1 primosomal protein N' [Pallidibacillus thermolactis]MED1672169.1 primosomal protein N' [Pallidibacillus thermolactis subsp. kokeshiiformis]
MKKIASVIVDVPTLQTNKPFDYYIPEEFIGHIEIGMRVVVPFGNRHIQGFVVGLKERSDIKNLKEIIEPMDVIPVLNKELLHIGDYLSEKTLCFKIAAYQVMLPPALKAKYEKYITLIDDHALEQLPTDLKKLFDKQKRLKWKDVEKFVSTSYLYRKAKEGLFEVTYEVKNQGNKKKVLYYVPTTNDVEHFQNKKNQLSKPLSQKQEEIYQVFLRHFQPHTVSQMERKVANARAPLNALVNKGLLKKEEYEQYRDPYVNRYFQKTKALPLTEDQQKAITPILNTIEEKQQEVFLLHGVTGSGKTEVYLQAIEKVINQGKEAIVLVPEISLTPQMVNRFKGRFGNLVAVLHSGLSLGEKYDEWRKIQRKEVKVVVGARSAIFAPFENIGIIIIDEEHENSYKQEDIPRYHARDIAIERSKIHHCPVVLGSATPSLESFARAKKGVYKLLTMDKRMNQSRLPTVEIVDMRNELKSGNRSMFSAQLFEKMQDRLAKKEQIVLMLNRRGYSSFVMCRDCGLVVKCPNCEISLTYHKVTDQLKCHYCGFETGTPKVCPECGSNHIRFFGTGTQKVEEELGKVLPEARVIRMDVDTTSRKGSHEKLLTDFGQGKADILLGTQMIAKGLDFPNITLVGVLSADSSLHIPDFRSSEKTFQLLTQVSGRAGRHQLPGEVIIQTYTPEHYSVQLAKNHDYLQFYRHEMLMRKQGQYPPFYYLVLIHINHEDVQYVYTVAEKIAQFLRAQLLPSSKVLGPAASPIVKIKNKYRYQVLIKYKHDPNITPALKKIIHHFYQDQLKKGLTISIDMNPYSLM